MSTAVGESDPETTGKKALQIRSLDNRPESIRTAIIVNELMREFHEAMKHHHVNRQRVKKGMLPANIILCRGAGTIPDIVPLTERFGVKAACIAGVPLIKGVCEVAGMDLVDVKGATGTPQTDFEALAAGAIRALQTNDLVVLHVKGMDVASHDGDVKLKVGLIEKVDKMLDRILKSVKPDSTYVAVTADHTTSCVTRNHEGDPVPVVISGPQVRSDDVSEFSERACAKGGLSRLRGRDLMPILMNLLGRTKKFGS